MKQYRIELSNGDSVTVRAKNINHLLEDIGHAQSTGGYFIIGDENCISVNHIVTIREMEDWEEME